jgi:hypothetical protein
VFHGEVIMTRSATTGLTPVLVLSAAARGRVQPGQLAIVDTGGPNPVTLTIASTEVTLAGDSLVQRAARSAGAFTAIDTGVVHVQLDRCHAGRCLSPDIERRYSATAVVGTRSLASLALPRS